MRSASLALAALVVLALTPPGAGASPTASPRGGSVRRVMPPARSVNVPAPTDASPLIVDAAAAPRHVSFVGQMETIRSGNTRAFAVIAEVQHRAPDDTRRTYLAPRVLYGQFVISRGAMSWDVDPAAKRVVVSENRAAMDPVAVVDDIALLDGNYRALRTGIEEVAQRKADVVDLVSRHDGVRGMRVWIDDQTHVVLGKEAYHGDGSLAWSTRFQNIRYTNDIPAAIFMASIPTGYQTIRGRSYQDPQSPTKAIPDAGFRPITPKYLPEGFRLTGADVAHIKDVSNLHLFYSDGIRTISLFENATGRAVEFKGLKAQTLRFEGHDAQFVRDGPTTLLAWRERGLAFALVGDLDLKELVPIAVSVVP